MLRKLQTVVGSDGLHKVILLEAFEDADNLVGNFRSSWVFKFPDPYFPCFPVVQRKDMLGAGCSDEELEKVSGGIFMSDVDTKLLSGRIFVWRSASWAATCA